MEEGGSLLITWGLPLFSILLLLVVWWLLNGRLKRQRLNDELELEKMEAERLKQLDQVKSDFFSNVTHEFRTPLTLILGHLEQVIPNIRDEQAKYELTVVRRNAKQLEKLINQLLDIAKIEADRMDLDLRRGNIVSVLKETHRSFSALAKQKGIDLQFHAPEPVIHMDFDPDKVELIFYNLLSNAFKFTDEGTISLSVSAIEKSGTPYAQLVVRDTGIGIKEEQLEKVFDRFYQSENSKWRKHKGTGIGLALVKDLVELHIGTIQLQSKPEKGTEITILLPVDHPEPSVQEIPEMESRDEELLTPLPAAPELQELSEKEMDAQNIVLIIEDNDDIRSFLKLSLSPSYQVFECSDGKSGIKKAQEIIPDIIISDIMMPGMDGFEVTRTLREAESTSHIPIILLTAKVGVENRIHGLEKGADAYVQKPFSSEELQARIRNLIEGRKRLKEKYGVQAISTSSEKKELSMEERFLQRVRDAVEKHLSNEHFTVEELSKEVGMSRAQLHRKLIALTGSSASRFIRKYRLEHARELLKQNVGTVSEISYRVGYSSPAYFTKCFTEDYGMPPSKVKMG